MALPAGLCHSFRPTLRRNDHDFEHRGAPIRLRIITGLGIMLLGITSTGDAFGAEDTTSQHQHWMRKLETPVGTLRGSPEDDHGSGRSGNSRAPWDRSPTPLMDQETGNP